MRIVRDRLCLIALLPIGSLAADAGTQPVSVTIAADRDTTLFQDPAGQIANGAGAYLFAGQTLRSGLDRRALIRFDVAPAIPAGAAVVSVELRLTCSRNNSAATTLNLHRVSAPWGEGASDAGDPGGSGAQALPGDATWLHTSYPGTFWTTIGGDFSPLVSASAPIADGLLALGPVVFASSSALVADVRSWVNDPSSNHGWALLSVSSVGSSAHRFDSRENPAAANRPTLVVVYTPPCVADFNASGSLSVQDLFDFLIAYFAQDPRTDINGVGGITVQDLFDYLAAYFAGC